MYLSGDVKISFKVINIYNTEEITPYNCLIYDDF